jgi:hypothetical protein
MKRVLFVPGVVATPAPITLPADAPDIDVVVSAEIERIPAAIAAHGHDLVSQGLGGAVANALGLPAGLNVLNDAGAAALHTVPKGGATGVQNSTALTGATPVVAAVPTLITSRTFSLSVSTALGDLLALVYQEVGVLSHP